MWILYHDDFPFIALMVVGTLSYLVPWLRKKWKKRKNEKRFQEILWQAKELGHLFFSNQNGDYTAICTKTAFEFSLGEYKKKLQNGEKKKWEQILIFANPTFSFWNKGDCQIPMHSGSTDELREIMSRIIRTLFKLEYDELTPAQIDEIAKVLVRKDGRLFVPFSGNIPTPEEQVKIYDCTFLHNVQGYFFYLLKEQGLI